MIQYFTKKHRGFTLIELLVVIAIIGVLASIVLVSLGGARAKARDAKRQSDIRQISLAMEMFYDDGQAYLSSATIPVAIGTYLNPVPTAPTGSYAWLDNTACTPAGSAYCLYATLENKGACTTTKYFAASQKGTKEICDTAPNAGCACW